MARRALPQLLDIDEAAAALKCSPRHIYRLIACNELPTVDISQPGARKPKSRIPETALSAFLERRTSKPLRAAG